jgi:hypothetical protein
MLDEDTKEVGNAALVSVLAAEQSPQHLEVSWAPPKSGQLRGTGPFPSVSELAFMD